RRAVATRARLAARGTARRAARRSLSQSVEADFPIRPGTARQYRHTALAGLDRLGDRCVVAWLEKPAVNQRVARAARPKRAQPARIGKATNHPGQLQIRLREEAAVAGQPF